MLKEKFNKVKMFVAEHKGEILLGVGMAVGVGLKIAFDAWNCPEGCQVDSRSGFDINGDFVFQLKPQAKIGKSKWDGVTWGYDEAAEIVGFMSKQLEEGKTDVEYNWTTK